MEQNTQEYRDMTENALQNEIKTAVNLFGPGQLATIVSVAITDDNFLKDFAQQLMNNYQHGR